MVKPRRVEGARTSWSVGGDAAREQNSRRGFRPTGCGRIPARPTYRVGAVNEQRHLGGEVGVIYARLGQELVDEFLPRVQMREGGLANWMAWPVDLE